MKNAESRLHGRSGATEVHEPAATWQSLSRGDWIPIIAAVVCLLLVTVPLLPPGICLDDAGELQVAAATLGITHAPGYSIYVSLGHLATLLPGVDAGYMVSVACLFAGVTAVLLCIIMQVRLGVRAWVAAAIGLVLAGQTRMWANLIDPEVYAPTLAVQAGSVYLLLRYTAFLRSRDARWAAFLFGIAVSSRPPVLLNLPFLVIALWLSARSREGRRGTLRLLLSCGLWAAIPGIYTAAFLYVRDTPSTPYNYIELHTQEFGNLPAPDSVSAKLQRIGYHLEGREFDYAIGPRTGKDIWKKLVWLRKEILLYRPFAFACLLATVVIGMVQIGRRHPGAAGLMAGMSASSLVFVLSYRMWGLAANYLPMLWSGCCALGAVTLPIRRHQRFVDALGAVMLCTVIIVTVIEAPDRRRHTLSADATALARDMDLASLPPDSVILVAWPETPVLFYACYMLNERDDLTLIQGNTFNWERMMAPYRDRPLFAASPAPDLQHIRFVKRGALWRIEP